MANYKWSFANVGGVTRVRIHDAEDIRHLGELDKKMWTVLSCPTTGLEISEESLRLIDLDGDGQLRVKEVVATAEWLCANLKDPQSLFEQKDELALDNIADEAIKAVAEPLAKDGKVSLADVDAAIAAVTTRSKLFRQLRSRRMSSRLIRRRVPITPRISSRRNCRNSVWRLFPRTHRSRV